MDVPEEQQEMDVENIPIESEKLGSPVNSAAQEPNKEPCEVLTGDLENIIKDIDAAEKSSEENVNNSLDILSADVNFNRVPSPSVEATNTTEGAEEPDSQQIASSQAESESKEINTQPTEQVTDTHIEDMAEAETHNSVLEESFEPLEADKEQELVSDEPMDAEKEQVLGNDESMEADKRDLLTGDEPMEADKQDPVTGDETMEADKQDPVRADESMDTDKQNLAGVESMNADKEQDSTSEENQNKEPPLAQPNDSDVGDKEVQIENITEISSGRESSSIQPDESKIVDDDQDISCNSLSANQDSETDKAVVISEEKESVSSEKMGETCDQSEETEDRLRDDDKSEETCEILEDKEDANSKGVEQMNGPDEHENDDSIRDNPIFEHVNTEKEDTAKNTSGLDQVIQDEDDFTNSQPQEDPIAADEVDIQDATDIPEGADDDSTKDLDEAEQGADEELCIIPDTERVISQEEKEAASAIAPIRDPTEEESSTVSTTSEQFRNEAEIDTSVEKFVVSNCTDDGIHSCIQCLLPKVVKYTCMAGQRTLYICDDNCLNSFDEENPNKVVHNQTGDLRVKDLAPKMTEPLLERKVDFIRKCSCCSKKVTNIESILSWETMDFCNELCLSKYQKKVGSNCSNCNAEVRSNCLGKYCVRFGYDIRQFCSSSCLEEFKKGLKVCSYCQKDISGGGDGFLAPVGDKGQFKDFCSQQCMEKYDVMSNHKKPVVKPGVVCSVCRNEKPITIEYEHNEEMNVFCGQPCFVAYKFVNTITPGKCDMCKRFFDHKVLEQHTMFYDDDQHSFCSKSCQNIYIIANRRIVPCSWCKVKKYNFDMIRRFCSSGQVLMMCSLNCLSLYQVSVNAVNLKKTKCDHCLKSAQPMYHLTMSDATIRNFCSYNCVMTFQNQFAKTPISLGEQDENATPVPTGVPKRSRRPQIQTKPNNETGGEISMPVISNVQSLAATTNGTVNARITRSKASPNVTANNAVQTAVKTQIKQQVIVRPAPLPAQRNMATMCKVIQSTKATSTRLTYSNKEIQTDEVKQPPIIIPVPVPIYVPTPLHMYSLPFPMPVPFPLPIPIPVFIPTTRNSANGIMKEIKKIQVKIPTDPFEAELLMMAEMVADDKKEENTSSESEEEDTAPPADEGTFSPEPVDASNTFGDDMLQMALKMASELDEPAVDLEGALTANTITASQGGDGAANEESVDDPQPMHPMLERGNFRGRKRAIKNSRQGTPSKRGRRASQPVEMPIMSQPAPQVPPEPVEKPDANMCLKYTFGVNAWKQWVTTKNAELEKSSRRVKLFKPEILQLTADELNYSLCLFVKEVRKPNGTEYAPDTIYYLCLGIQQYLFENGRIDNIFCDAYYEKFTDCLDEVARKFSVLYNDSHYIVTRVEEEHLWESKQLGAHSPHVLLSTLMFFNTKHFNLTTVDEHMQLSFSHIMKHWKRNPNQPGTAKAPGSRNVLLRFYPPQSAIANARKKKVYEQAENEENPLRCPVKLYEFYLSKCPESVKTRNDVFYLQPERSCVPDSPVWYSTMPLPREALEKMLHRVKMVKEINVALLTS